jgi:hypothetical protein
MLRKRKTFREGIAMKPHLHGIWTAIIVQQYLYSFLNLRLLAGPKELLCFGAVIAKGSEGKKKI